MVFFGGFGSCFPYLIYLSVIWICVLIGFKGQLSAIFTTNKEAENSASIEYESGETDQNCYILTNLFSKDDVSRHHASILKNLFGFIHGDGFVIKFLKQPDEFVRDIKLDGHFLRAPPQLSV